MKRIFLFTTLAMLLFISCGGGPTETLTETLTETAIEDSISPATEYESVNNSSNEIDRLLDEYEIVCDKSFKMMQQLANSRIPADQSEMESTMERFKSLSDQLSGMKNKMSEEQSSRFTEIQLKLANTPYR